MQGVGLLDTGTTRTAITPQVIQELNLSPTGRERRLAGPTGRGSASIYFVDLLLPLDDGNIFIPQQEVLGLLGEPSDYAHFQVLLGLDILCRGTFTMSGDGAFTFEIPE
jgi:hypothetical protein